MLLGTQKSILLSFKNWRKKEYYSSDYIHLYSAVIKCAFIYLHMFYMYKTHTYIIYKYTNRGRGPGKQSV